MRTWWAAALVVLTLVLRPVESPADTRSRPEPNAEARASLERIIRTKGFTRGVPRDCVPSPDGRRVYFLQSGGTDPQQALCVFDVATRNARPLVDNAALGAVETISPEEQARRERQRQTERGIASFQLSRDGALIVFPYSGDLWIVETATGAVRQVTRTPEPEIDPQLSPDAKQVSYLRGNGLYVTPTAGGVPTPIATSEDPEVTFGAAEFIAQEEMDRTTGQWWSPDSRALIYTRVETRDVPRFQVPDLADPLGGGRPGPYPKPGDPNARVTLHVQVLGEQAPRALELGEDVEYVARIHWAPQSNAVWVQTQPRTQRRVDIRRVDVATGKAAVVWREEERHWVDLHDDFHLLANGSRFLWKSSRSGHAHLEVREASGALRKTLTSGDWDVGSVVDVDERRGTVTLTTHRAGPLEQQLERVPLGGGKLTRLTQAAGWHEAKFHPAGHDVGVVTFSDDRIAPQTSVVDRNGNRLGTIPSAASPPEPGDLGPEAQYIQLPGPGGEPLDIRLVRPAGTHAAASVPLVVYVYGGPGSQQVKRAWPGERGLFDGWLAKQGFAVARIDARGVGPRGKASRAIYAGRLGLHEIDDQVAGVRALLQHAPELDARRVGVWGWSYGGYATLFLLARAPDLFRVGVSVAPVVDWRGYDTHYTERYLGLPAMNPAGYDSSSVLAVADRIRGHLTLVHGASDDNVHFRESMILARRLQSIGTPFDLMVYPGTHMMETLQERLHLYELVWRTFQERL